MTEQIRHLPSCCGSEDGELVYGVDLTSDSDTMVELWACNTCGVFTVTCVVHTGPTDRSTTLSKR